MNRKNNKKNVINLLPIIISIMFLYSLFMMNNPATTKKIDYLAFQDLLKNEQIEKINLSVSNILLKIDGTYIVEDKKQEFYLQLPNTSNITEGLIEQFEEQAIVFEVGELEKGNFWLEMVLAYVPYLLLFGAGYMIFSKMGNTSQAKKSFEFGKSRARLQADIKVKFDDVAGCDEEKEEMQELVSYLKSPKRFSKMGARIPKGVLLVGPPGTGKTLLAKAVAGESDVPFFSISGSDFVEMFVGVGANRVREMFKEAKQVSPCIIFIDEIDAVGRERGAGLGGGHDEREQTLNQLLVEMDGINDNSGVLILAATNRSDILDPALLRAGRFDRQIMVSLPDRKARFEILQVHARNKNVEPNIDLNAIAKRTPGFSGADLENVLNESAILAVRSNREVITLEDIDEAIDRVLMGPAKRSRTYTDKERKLVAYHEAGHAVIGLFLENASVVRKITIIPRGMAGGYNLMTPKEETFLNTKSDLLAKITSYLGGRVAEEVFLDDISTGASSDIQEATKIARAMVVELGMSDLGPIQYQSQSGSVFLGRDYASAQNYSGEVAYEIDKAVRHIIEECYETATSIIKKHTKELELLVDALLEYDTITAEQIDNVINERPINFNLSNNGHSPLDIDVD